MPKGLKLLRKEPAGRGVLDLALERIDHAYGLYDRMIVAFSGGKDSTAVLNLTLEVAAHRGRLPVPVVFYDEEAIAPHTHDYVDRVRADERVDLTWLCVPIKHRNGCSRSSPFWYPWAQEDEALWVRAMPAWGVDLPDFRRESMPEANRYLCRPGETTGILMGIRADESMNRMRSLLTRTNDNYITADPFAAGVYLVKPIYDWRTPDVWTAPRQFGWDYNRAYDLMESAGIPHRDQRIAPPYGEQPMQSLWMWSVCWPELWAKMSRRVPGAATGARYAGTALYSFGSKPVPPEGMTYQEAIVYYATKHGRRQARRIATRLRAFMLRHRRLSGGDEIPETRGHHVTGLSWAFMLKVAIRGDIKERLDPLDERSTRY